jgi:hypothetical protein
MLVLDEKNALSRSSTIGNNSGDRGNESAVLPLNYRPNPMEGEVSLLKR